LLESPCALIPLKLKYEGLSLARSCLRTLVKKKRERERKKKRKASCFMVKKFRQNIFNVEKEWSLETCLILTYFFAFSIVSIVLSFSPQTSVIL